MEILEHYPLGAQTTFAVGGVVRYFATATSIDDLHAAYSFAKERHVPVTIIGGGSNTLIDDGEANALFIRPTFVDTTLEGTTVITGAGESWDDVVAYSVEAGLYGLENLSGIPGSVGGAVVQNIGAYGAALSESVAWVDVFDTHAQQRMRLTAAACGFGYRDSVFKQHPERYIVLRLACALTREGAVSIGYRDLAEYFSAHEPTLPTVRAAVLTIRAGKFPDLTAEGTAGSFFKNPVVSLEEGERLQQTYPALPLFPLPEASGYKVPLAWILDRVLSMRGFAIGNVRCFEKQPLVLVANRHATAHEVRVLARAVAQRVFDETKIVIEPEVCVMRGATIAHALDF